MDQDFGRNRKTAEMGGYCNLLGLQEVQNLAYLKHTNLVGAVREPPSVSTNMSLVVTRAVRELPLRSLLF